MTIFSISNGEQRQEYSWGSMNWLHAPSGSGMGSLGLAIVAIHPESSQETHNHYADEQILYGLEGTTKHLINGREYDLAPGNWLHIPAYANHGIVNDSKLPARFLFVATPVWQPQESIAPTDDNHRVQQDYIQNFLNQTNLQEVQKKFANAIGLGVGLIDSAGVQLTEPDNLSCYCCHCMHFHGGCQLLEVGEHGNFEVEWIRCKYGLVVARLPVKAHGLTIMYVLCGFAFMAQPTKNDLANAYQLAQSSESETEEVLQSYQDVPQITRNRLFSAAELLRVTAFSLADLFLAAAKENELKEYSWRLLQEKQQRTEAEANLQRAKIRLMEAQINPHFLFNTLNTISQSAELQGATTTAELVYSLSGLMRFSLQKTGSFVTLGEELECIDSYLHIQRHRFGERFEFFVDIPNELRGVILPAMTLQPLIENAFIHGFVNLDARNSWLKIVATPQEGKMVRIEIADNGTGIKPEQLDRIRHTFANPDVPPYGTGLQGVYWRLKHYYGLKSNINISSSVDNGTVVTIVIPLSYKPPSFSE